MWRCWLITAALTAASDDLPSNMLTLRNVCVQETTITLHASTADAKGQLCGLTACHAPQARERCRENDDDAFVAGVLAEALPRFRVRRSMEAYPVATARRYERVALFTLTGNIGHDLYNGLLDVFSSSLARRFDALFTNVMWFTGRQSWDASVARPDTSWSLTVVDALFNETSTPLYWASDVHMVGTRFEHLPSLGLCADEFVVRAQGRLAENVGWDALPALPSLRDKVLARVLTDVSKREKLTLYTRGDARRRRFQGNVQNFASRLGATKVLARMPRGDPRQQIALYASSDVVVAPFGSNTANSVFMRPGSVFVEVSPLCPSLCEEGCHPYSKTLSGNMADNYNISRANACLNLMADGPPLHRYSGVNYHIVPTCSGTLRCASGKMVEPSGRPVEMRKAWKANFNDDLDVDAALPRVLEILRGRSPQTRVAPFAVACPRVSQN